MGKERRREKVFFVNFISMPELICSRASGEYIFGELLKQSQIKRN